MSKVLAASSTRLLQVWGFGGALEKSIVESTFVMALERLGLRWKVQYWDLEKDLIAQTGAVADKVVVLAPKDKATIWCEAVSPLGSKAEVWALDPCVPIQQILSPEVNRWIAKLFTGEPPKGTSEQAIIVHPVIVKVITPSPVIGTKPSLPKAKKISVGRETKGRAGKGVTTLFDIPLNAEQIKELATTLKQKCGTGGTVKDGCIEIQGDQRERIVLELQKLGFQVKRVGG